MLRVPELARAPRGRGEPVLVLPGFAASDASTLALRSYLRWLGYDARGWGLGTNGGDLPALVPRVILLLEAQAAAARERVRCVGWSLGGNLARESARERPDLVERVVTLGTPAVGGPKYTSVARSYRRRGLDLDAVETRVAKRERVPIRVPISIDTESKAPFWNNRMLSDPPYAKWPSSSPFLTGTGGAPLGTIVDLLCTTDAWIELIVLSPTGIRPT